MVYICLCVWNLCCSMSYFILDSFNCWQLGFYFHQTCFCSNWLYKDVTKFTILISINMYVYIIVYSILCDFVLYAFVGCYINLRRFEIFWHFCKCVWYIYIYTLDHTPKMRSSALVTYSLVGIPHTRLYIIY